MFREAISQTSMNTPQADMYFNSMIVGGGDFQGDKTLISTLRGLLYDKIEDGKVFASWVSNYNYGNKASMISNVNHTVREHLEFFSNSSVLDVINLVDYSGVTEDFPVNDLIAELPIGYHMLVKVTELFRKNFKCPPYCFINEELKSVVIVTKNLEIKHFHLLQCALVGMMPWYFDTKNIDEDRMALIYSMKEKSSDNYIKALQKIADKVDFRTGFIKNALKGFETQFEKKKITELEASIRNYNSNIEDLSYRISQALTKIRELNYQLIGLQEKVNAGVEENEIMDFFLANKHLNLINATNGVIKFVVSDYLTYFDEDQAEKMINKESSYLYYNNPLSFEDMKAVLKAIFIDKEIKLRVCAAYEIDTNDMTVRAIGQHRYGADYAFQMPNPHIDGYSCLGNYTTIFRECMANHDYLTAVTQAIASAKSLNFGDSVVMQRFASILAGNVRTGAPNSDKCLELPDGSVVNLVGAIRWIRRDEIAAEEGEVAHE